MLQSTTSMITLSSNDGVVFEVPETVAKQSQLLCRLIDDPNHTAYNKNSILLQKVTAPILAKVIEYCWKHVYAADASKTETTEEGSSTTPASLRISDDELRNWDNKFVDVDEAMLCDLIMAADYLEINGLFDVLSKKVGNAIKEEIEAENKQISENTTSRMITLRSKEEEVFEVPETVAKQSKLLRQIMDNPLLIAYFQNSITLHTITKPILAKVIEYCSNHIDAADVSKTETTEEGSSTMPASSRISVEEMRNWDKQFVDVKPATLHALTKAADYLGIEGLRDVLSNKNR